VRPVEEDGKAAEASTGILRFSFHSVLLSVHPILLVFSRDIVHITFKDTVRSLALSVGLF
jgi:hypothetical protein